MRLYPLLCTPLPGAVITRIFSLMSFFIVYIALATPLYGQISDGGTPVAIEKGLELTKVAFMDLSDHPVLLEQLDAEEDAGFGPMKAGFGIPLDACFFEQASRTVMADGTRLWQLAIYVPGAHGLGLAYDNFFLAEGVRMFVYSSDHSFYAGAFSSLNNNPERVFTTHVMPGETLVIEVEEPPVSHDQEEGSSILLKEVVYIDNGGGLPLLSGDKGLNDAGDCHVGINCPEGSEWQDQKRGIARIILRAGSSYFYCSGTLINNTLQNGAPFFLTADHCGVDASPEDYGYWQFYFNYERRGCAQAGSVINNMITGASFRARGPLDNGSDFKLLMLNSAPPADYYPYYNGWSLSGMGSPEGVSIHHPAGDSKMISTYRSALSSSDWPGSNGSIEDAFWRVNWVETMSGHGVTEGGSSGAPLFNYEGLVVGTLTGGASTCVDRDRPDFFGKMGIHWRANGAANNFRLEPWLDAAGEGNELLEGLDPFASPYKSPVGLAADVSGDEVALSWLEPGSFMGPEGWVTYNTGFTHLSWERPQRATRFDVADFDYAYPVTLHKLAHYFYEQEGHLWPDNRFNFVVYGSDGNDVLYQSPVQKATKNTLHFYTLEEGLDIQEKFYVAVVPVDNSGHPSSVMKEIGSSGSVRSFVGGPGNWQSYQDDNNRYEFYSLIYIAGEKQKGSGPTEEPVSPEFVTRAQPVLMDSGPKNSFISMVEKGESTPGLVGYKLYRNNQLIAALDDSSANSFVDKDVPDGQYAYYVTALYNEEGASARSNEVLLTVKGVPELQEVNFLVTDQHDQPLNNAQINVTTFLDDGLAFHENWSMYSDFCTNLYPWKTKDPIARQTFVSEDFSFNGESQPFGFMVFNPEKTSPPLAVEAVSGRNVVISMASAHQPKRDEDKWLISPAIHLDSHARLTFQARSLTHSYGLERIRVLVSTTGTSYDDFTDILSPLPFIQVPAHWTSYEFDLSDYTGKDIYIAIHCVSYDAFMLMLDDFSIHHMDKDPAHKKQSFLQTDEEGVAETALARGRYQYRVTIPDYSGYREVFSVYEEGLDFEVVLFDDAYMLDLVPEPADGGQVLDLTDAGPYEEGREVTVEADPAEKFLFSHWSRSGENEPLSTDARYTFTMEAEDLVLVATFEQDPTSVAEPSGKDAVLVFPNPAKSQLFIHGPPDLSVEGVRLLNLQGQTVYGSKGVIHLPWLINTSTLGEGIYVLQLMTKEGLVTRRIQVISE